MSQYLDVLDSRVILGINGLFYITNALPLYVGMKHVFMQVQIFSYSIVKGRHFDN